MTGSAVWKQRVGRVLVFRRKLRWWLAFIVGTFTLSFTGDLEAAKRVLDKLFEGAADNSEQVS